ncbi:hypothetical protein QC762_000025 [Podospora pseudocomata]|uniref:Uncharacterized protein n=1 Tax=Podospora pseudocomata TaxID=2093779 RepID=A0ABR0G8K4_9PEZI|nr:hypothetical protein QC762_000025 [Podospora pseudocomata]
MSSMQAAYFSPDKPEPIKKIIMGWVKENSQKVSRIHQFGYGWEAWLQADLGYRLAVQLNGAGLRRETFVYNDLRRVDLNIYGNAGPTQPWHLFEFKCKTPTQNTTEFLRGLLDDWDKLEDVVIGKDHARLWAVGFWVDDDMGKPNDNRLANWNFEKGNGVNVMWRSWYSPKPTARLS